MDDIAWVLGAGDPISGTVSLHEVIRGFGALLKKGWKPLRTGNAQHSVVRVASLIVTFIVVFASWDGEEVRIKHLSHTQTHSNVF
jgi:hypothetical protein